MTRNMVNRPSGLDLCLRAHRFPYQLFRRTVLDQDLQDTEPDTAAQEMRGRINIRQCPSQIEPVNAKDAIAILLSQIRQIRLSSRGDHEM